MAAAAKLFGFTPGLEYAAAVAGAQERGCPVVCADAPLRLQEAWVKEFLSGFGIQVVSQALPLSQLCLDNVILSLTL